MAGQDMVGTQNSFADLTAIYNEVAAGNMRGREAFVALREIQSQLRHRHHLDPGQDGAYYPLNTTRQEFNRVLGEKYFLAARQNYEDSTDERFIGANRSIQEALSDLHLVPAYMAIGKEATGNKEPLTGEDWKKIGVTEEGYQRLFNTRRTDEARRIWGFAKDPARDYQSFTHVIHDVGYYLKQAGFDLSDKEKVFAALGTTGEEFDGLVARRQQEEQARHVAWHKVEPAVF
jgi:hypothetical protein